jgi:anhydro-N-acetylmuramic acid kinase
MRVAGLMSGTSLDGIDVAIVDISGHRFRQKLRLVAHYEEPYPAAVREALLSVSNTMTHTAPVARLHFLLGELYAEAVRQACRKRRVALRSIELVGCHGQTIFHEGEPIEFLGRRVASTFQIGDPAVLAERLGVPVVSNFRERDVAAGGKGAPLVPLLDCVLLRSPKLGRVALNIGGIANITAIPAGARPEQVVAFDTGPGNMVIDALVQKQSGGWRKFDPDGAIAAAAAVDPRMLEAMLSDPYYARRPPKSTGREQYGAEYVSGLIATGLPLDSLIATATELTARTIALGIERFVRFPVHELIAAGGGIHNRTLMRRLQELLPRLRFRTTRDFGIEPDAKEAVAFALLAYETWHGRPANLPAATGARAAVPLGRITPGPGKR